MSFELIDAISYADVERMIDDISGQYSKAFSSTLINTLNETTEKTGNIVGGAGQPLSHDMVFEMLEKIEHDFGEGHDGNMVMIVHPDMMGRIAALENEFQSSPQLKKRFEDLMEIKREHHRGREMDRNLAG